MKDDFSVRVERAFQSSNRWVTMWCWPEMTRDDQLVECLNFPLVGHTKRAGVWPLCLWRGGVHMGTLWDFGPVSGKNHFPKPLYLGFRMSLWLVDVAFLGKELPPWNWCLRSAGFGSGATLVNQTPMVAWPPMCVSKQVPFWIYVTHTLIVIISTIWGVISCTILFMSQQYIPIWAWVKTWYYHQSIH